ncbi:MAG: phenylalanine--tRNA ligase subunit alpha [Candidatus Marinimicrobia bacterium]|jgi:phenylalanyl-tRNA synthetase alpha chain|nr:phenylalanine--tRNA ligase subunit alpha [Candidatus Neomarinimicrobiota bacterium]MBT3496001.1 phenylalanine--tRNA ligase subunit alpha [Candidatus Neomarinimicrobiota bacterium]MBT3692547.1 phenylalanine--tRNA ligase subunit alpha [Candidatus Neomarinimicrobiota bacterium]MBT3732474.1 phenylalanine--tRNA ligase subunit alpha [Candidatus Neomarinimicrobiota bacterium]MBT4144957.1 phenylalanine--tRNA ligase subunit alpha [Candidatus Neomarinimicrobiota bacterium]
MSLKENIDSVRSDFLADIESFPNDAQDIENLRVKYLGRKGLVAGLFSSMGNLSAEERPQAGQLLNALKNDLSEQFQKKMDENNSGAQTQDPYFDATLPGIAPALGSMHPLERTLQEIKDIFISIGFHVEYGPEIDDDYHNFSALNFPEHHPARDMQDTFFVAPDTVLRTHTSNVQIHLMENEDPPIRHIVPGRVYRNEAISFKSYCLFHQVEGIYVDKNVSFGELKGVLEYFVRQMFGPKVKMRFRPSFFPFTEPSAEVDIWSTERNQWLEILGCGMVDPAVFDNVGYDSSIWHGYAFGMGVERIAMLKYKIDDIRHFYQGDVRFLRQFK